jgi:mRNA-degrading endonuclease YafQ of YafQ-DinJ toxin-antitoxin module
VKIFEEVKQLPEFDKDLKKLKKRFMTIEGDLDTLIKTELALYHKLGIDNNGIFEIADLNIPNPKIYKVKKFACRSLKDKGVKTGLRLIYAHYEDKNIVELEEIYYKGDKENEDRERIYKYYKKSDS